MVSLVFLEFIRISGWVLIITTFSIVSCPTTRWQCRLVKKQLQHQKLLIDIPCSPISPKNNVEQGLTNDDFRIKKIKHS